MPDQLFDPIHHTHGAMPHLLQLLHQEYMQHLLDRTQPGYSGEEYKPVAEGSSRASLPDFMDFATGYLATNRVVENFFLDMNHGIRLSNQKSCSICPGTDVAGTMQDSGAVAVTQGLSQKGMEGVVPVTNALRIT
jgi:hypothetical protein